MSAFPSRDDWAGTDPLLPRPLDVFGAHVDGHAAVTVNTHHGLVAAVVARLTANPDGQVLICAHQARREQP